MKTSEIMVENYENVYEHFRDYELDKKGIRRLFGLGHFLFKARVNYAKGAREELDLIHDKDYHHIYVFNHRGNWDPCVYFSILRQVAPYDEGAMCLLANSFVYEAVHLRPFGKLLKDFGFFPVFLKSYYANDKPHRDHPERLKLLPPAAEKLFESLVYVQTQRRQKVLVCPEGEYNKGAPDTILTLHKGTAEIARRTAAIDGPVAITTIGFAYGKKRRRFVNPFGTSAYVGRSIFVEAGMTTDEITKRISKQLLASVKKAVRLY